MLATLGLFVVAVFLSYVPDIVVSVVLWFRERR